jgi:hypothetical protein
MEFPPALRRLLIGIGWAKASLCEPRRDANIGGPAHAVCGATQVLAAIDRRTAASQVARQLPESKALRNRWGIPVALFLVRLTMGIQFQSIAAVAPLLGRDFGVSLADIGLLIGLYFTPA